jgi:hypothetical protein
VVVLAALALATLPLTLLARPSAAARSGLVDE